MTMKFPEHALAHEFLDELQGLEIGASSHNPFGLKTRNVAPLDDYAFYSGAQQKMDVAPARVDIWASADAIPVPNDSEDFIISSHVVEHLPNVIATFWEWNRIVRTGGYIFMIVPRRDALPEDVGREITPLRHFLDDFRLQTTLDTHPTEGVPGGRMGHYHVFEPASILALVDWMRDQKLCAWQLVAREDVDTKVGNGFTLVFRVLTKSGLRANETPIGDLVECFSTLAEQPDKEPARKEDPSFAALAKTVTEHNQFIASQQQIIQEKNRLINEKQAAIDDLSLIIQTEENSTAGRAVAFVRSLRDFLCPANTWRRRAFAAFRKATRLVLSDAVAGRFQKEIGKWSRKRQGLAWDARRRAKVTAELALLKYQPLISIVTPVYNVAELWLRSAIESVREQIYPHWELCLVNDASTVECVKPILDDYAASDGRIRVKHLETNAGIAGASNQALDLATGEFVGLLDHDDELTPDALVEVVKRLNEDPALDLVYSDEDKMRVEGVATDPFFKPGWNPDLLLSCNYITHFSLFRRGLLQKIGGFQQGFEGSQDYDLLLRFTEETQRIAHIPKVLYHWRAIRGSTAASPTAKPSAYTAARRAIGQALRRRGYEAKVESISPGIYRVCYPVRDNPRVTILIPVVSGPRLHQGESAPLPASGRGWGRGVFAALRMTQAKSGDRSGGEEANLHRCITSLTQVTNYPNYEIIVLTQGTPGEPREKPSLPHLAGGKVRASCVAYRLASDLSIGAVMNLGARRAQGDYLIFLNPELQIIRPDWLAALLEQAQRKEVAAVGAKLLGADGQLVHSGMVVGPQGLLSHWDKNLAANSIHRLVYTEVVRDCSAVSADCLMVAKQKFEEVSGFDGRWRRAYHDVDFCLRLARKGYLTVYTPHAAAQFTSRPSRPLLRWRSRGEVQQSHSVKDERLFQQIWGNHLQEGDPYFNPLLSQKIRLAG
jgi:glycosyltransferase involved in cell wall biosynthesis/SAM-dependent methyltransferase